MSKEDEDDSSRWRAKKDAGKRTKLRSSPARCARVDQVTGRVSAGTHIQGGLVSGTKFRM